MRRLHLSVSKIDTKYRIIDKWDKKPYVLDGLEIDYGGFTTKTSADLVKRYWKRYTLDKKNLPATAMGFNAFLKTKFGFHTTGFVDLKVKIDSRMTYKAPEVSEARVVAPRAVESIVEAARGPSAKVSKAKVGK
jgi:hypothetical protein